jgi:hypothetical protein
MIAFNIGYKHDGSYSSLNLAPFIWNDTFKQAIKSVRYKYNIKTLFKWAKKSSVPPSMICLYVTTVDDNNEHNFIIHMMNVREYKAYWNKVYNK